MVETATLFYHINLYYTFVDTSEKSTIRYIRYSSLYASYCSEQQFSLHLK